MSPNPAQLQPTASRWLWLGYVGGVVAIGLLQGTSELQHYLANGGPRAWEPYLWELSSAVVVGVLAPLIYRWHVAALGRGLLWRHALGAVAFTLVHVGGMFAIRFGVYAAAGLGYDPGNAQSVLAYEAGKDLVSYALIVAICHGGYLFVQTQRRLDDTMPLMPKAIFCATR